MSKQQVCFKFSNGGGGVYHGELLKCKVYLEIALTRSSSGKVLLHVPVHFHIRLIGKINIH